jgi:hypothetical protein
MLGAIWRKRSRNESSRTANHKCNGKFNFARLKSRRPLQIQEQL